MNKITNNDLKFEDVDEANKFVSKYNIILFQDDDDVIICYQSSSEKIRELWGSVVEDLAYYFQSNLIDDILSRNLLLVFCANDDIDINTKKEIQSNTYCCRKIARSKVSDLEGAIKDLIFFDTTIQGVVNTSSLSILIKERHPEVFNLLSVKDETK
ncbi:hypothetical protein GW590_16845 [Rahnella sp. SAP-1]|uniref:Uncharacterized protein n=1 Tax=Rouxiella aceris TaxID=2703884 RepID=A0A848MNT2_9GAMM|nr:ABC-three component system middle component 1 [Rouxiella aceris]NMP28532.1 hypothetical protein [Rouxiella aceris]